MQAYPADLDLHATNTATPYGARSITRSRRTKSEIDTIKAGLYSILEEQHPATVRGTFYQAVSKRLIDKTEAEYKGTVGRLLTQMRRDGDLPYGWLADNTRWMRKPKSYDGLEQMLQVTVETYRRSMWQTQDVYVEIWLEKDAMAGVIYEVTANWDVPLMVTRGYPSITFTHSAAEAIAAQGKPTFIYYLGDRDPSGVDIPRKVEQDLREFAPDAIISFETIAVTETQIEELDLPTRPTKTTDTRSRNFEGRSVEVDAIPAPYVRGLVTEVITDHIDPDALEQLEVIEAAERDSLRQVLAGMRGRS